MTAIIFDTETTDIHNPEIIESSWMQAEFSNTNKDTVYPTLQFGIPVTKRF